MRARPRRRSRSCAPPRGATRTCCRRCARRCACTAPSASAAACCGTSSAPTTASPTNEDGHSLVLQVAECAETDPTELDRLIDRVAARDLSALAELYSELRVTV